jgi:hypothetical protein
MHRLLLLLFLASPVPAFGDDLQKVNRLADAGAMELALRQVDARLLNSLDPAWVRLRIRLLEQLGQRQEVLSAMARLPDDYPADVRRDTLIAAARSALALKRPEHARRYLATALWRTPAEGESYREMRRLIVQSYLTAADATNAYPVWLRYVQDFSDPEPDLMHQAAMNWLESGQIQHAMSLLSHLPPAGALSVLIRLRAGMLSTRDAAALERDDDALWWLVRRYSAIYDNDPARQIAAEEHLLQTDLDQAPPASQVWLNYMLLAQQHLSRTEQTGDAQWLEKSRDAKESVISRALLAWLAMKSDQAAIREQAQLGLLDALIGADLPQAALRLFREGLSEAELTQLSDAALYRLGLHAESLDDLPFAAKLWTRIDRVPAGMEAADWRFRRADLYARADRQRMAVEEALTMLEGPLPISREAAHRLQQLAQSMMDRGQYPAAEQLLAAMLDKTELFQQREVLYSLGLIAEQRGDLGLAAARYLEAATLQSSDALDAQAQLARLQAASVLTRAGLHRDARRQYEMVLSVTRDEGRRELIRRALARL